MLTKAISDIMIKKYDNYQVYIHNMSNFDAIFLLKILVKLGNCKPIIHNRELISIGLKFKDYNITFKDSYKLIIGALRKLAKVFGVDTQKSIFPHKFVNKNNLNYIGKVPDIKYFDNITLDEYNKYNLNFIKNN
jgi:hypothetical protein